MEIPSFNDHRCSGCGNIHWVYLWAARQLTAKDAAATTTEVHIDWYVPGFGGADYAMAIASGLFPQYKIVPEGLNPETSLIAKILMN